MPVKIALPKGRLLSPTSDLLERAGWALDEYNGNGRYYHLRSAKFPELRGKVLHERDIPVQVAVGNYDLGICGLDWIEELLAKYPGSALVKVREMGFGRGSIYAAVAAGGADSMEKLRRLSGPVRIASEYPNLAELFALRSRFSRFSVFPVWGGADVYPPETAEMALVSSQGGRKPGLALAGKVLDYGAFLIANRASWESKDLLELVASIPQAGVAAGENAAPDTDSGIEALPDFDESLVRLALPDGHQQQPAVQLLNEAGVRLDDYPSATGNRRPGISLEGFTVKVIRPQDMPLQVANGHFDLAVTGRDWLKEHLYQFPTSPIEPLLDLGFGGVRIVAVVSQELPVNDTPGLRQYAARGESALRLASEYINIADRYARENHLGPYRVIPTWGATEAYVPEDADILIENTQTGTTIARHNLKIIDTLFESTACLVGYKDRSPEKKSRIEGFVKLLAAALGKQG